MQEGWREREGDRGRERQRAEERMSGGRGSWSEGITMPMKRERETKREFEEGMRKRRAR